MTPDQLLNERLINERATKDEGNSAQRLSTSGGVVRVSNFPDMFGDVVDFHRKFDIQYDGSPRELPKDLLIFRIKRLNEEHVEYLDAVDMGDHEKQLDALVDIVYIALGTAHLHGWDFNEAWRRVHAANMAKERASATNPGKYGIQGCKHDIVKPAGWVPPKLHDLV